jgi:hypothetical protein
MLGLVSLKICSLLIRRAFFSRIILKVFSCNQFSLSLTLSIKISTKDKPRLTNFYCGGGGGGGNLFAGKQHEIQCTKLRMKN